MTEGWTFADQAELDVLLHELMNGYRERCDACSPEPCPVLELWREHKAGCPACRGHAPPTYPRSNYCRRGDRLFVEHGETCARCNPGPRLQAARELCDSREARILLSRAQALRAPIEERAA